MAQITVTISHTFRHRWLGLTFLFVACAPFALVGVEPSKRTTDWLVGIAYCLMGPKVTVS